MFLLLLFFFVSCRGYIGWELDEACGRRGTGHIEGEGERKEGVDECLVLHEWMKSLIDGFVNGRLAGLLEWMGIH